ncbi:aminotransferase class IV [Parabacteroides sp. FAFU027]|uniref:aminotransferase class IV n=1 Tax=Parabacteroides sp. FAFU027 TaxID=2922715 RepID=UPI001FAFB4D1|nr:aminotransferase class IV [Parabacteroides sp. FAFU027]
MSLLLESVRIVNGQWMNAAYHRQRMDDSTMELFGKAFSVDFETIEIPAEYRKGIVKGRIIYDTQVREVGFDHYSSRKIGSLQLVYEDNIDYHLKWADRTALNELVKQKGTADEILIIKNGFVTDISYANVVVRYKDRLATPAHCLLKGTRRRQLLDQLVVVEEDITVDKLFQAESVIIINAMLGLEEAIEIPISRIFR